MIINESQAIAIKNHLYIMIGELARGIYYLKIDNKGMAEANINISRDRIESILNIIDKNEKNMQ